MGQSRKYLCATVAGVALTLASRPAVAQSCSRDAIQRAADEVRTLRERLLATKIRDGGMDTSVTPASQQQIAALKDALAAAASAYLHCEPGNSVDLKAMQTSLLERMAVHEPKENDA